MIHIFGQLIDLLCSTAPVNQKGAERISESFVKMDQTVFAEEKTDQQISDISSIKKNIFD